MKKTLVALCAALCALAPFKLKADEGMWLPLLIQKLNIDQMHELGLQLSAEDIYDINHSSLKDAIVQFGNGCTGEIVSPEGLLFTNHHCGYGQIQSHSTVEHDYLTNGFWAMSKAEELPCPGLTVKFLVRMENVSQKVLSRLDGAMSEEERVEAIEKIRQELVEEASEGGRYLVHMKSYFSGNEFYLLVYEEYKDVRLVGAPPSSIGKYGSDADNWMWPRHTCDFSVFRVYMSPDGKPAEYSEENVPLKPKHYLPVSIAGVQQDDYAMIMGYPGSTQRFLPSWGVEEIIDYTAPAVVKTRQAKLDVLDQHMDADPAVRIKYASIYAQIANYWKYFIGQGKQLKRNKVVEKKQEIEKEFAAWAAGQPEYAGVLENLEDAYGVLTPAVAKLNMYLREAILGPQVFAYATYLGALENAMERGDADQVKNIASSLSGNLAAWYKDYDWSVNRDMISVLLRLYYEDINPDYQPESFRKMVSKQKGDFDAIAQHIMENTILADSATLAAFLAKPDLKKLQKDPAYSLVMSVLNQTRVLAQDPEIIAAGEKLSKNMRLFVKGIREMNPDKAYAPDANLTMRVTYGQVKDYKPADAVHYDFVTTIDGVMEKEDPTNPDFIVPKGLKDLYQKKDYGQYGDSTLVTCFLTTNDITGGNSGSPVINANGELIGLAFDGNWEAMSGDIYYEPMLQRTIVVDARYVLFIIDKYAGATNLIDELTIVKERPCPMAEETNEAGLAPSQDVIE